MFDRASADDTPTPLPALPDTSLAPAVVVAAGADSIDPNAVTRVTAFTATGSRSGTGFALDDGRIATVAHALVEARSVQIGELGAATESIDLAVEPNQATVDRANDLAVVTSSGLAGHLTIADSEVTAGDEVVVAGFGRDQRLQVVAGSVVGRSPGSAYGVDHPDLYAIGITVSEGWSGGPVTNATGEVVAVVVGTEQRSGVALAVPSEYLPELDPS